MTTRGWFKYRLWEEEPPVIDPAPDPSSPLWGAAVVGLTDAKGRARGWGVSVVYQSVRQPGDRVLHIANGDPLGGVTFKSMCRLELVTERARPFAADDVVDPDWFICDKCESYRARS